MTTRLGVAGYAPGVRIEPYNPEQAKYAKLWRDVPDYRAVAPGEDWAMTFLAQAKPPKDAEVIDFGAGTGRAAVALALVGRCKVTMLDFVEHCLDDDVRAIAEAQPDRLTFAVHDLTKMPKQSAAYGYCCDVMEHIPPDDVRKVLLNILSSAQHCFFAISTVDDVMGARIGQPLHLTIRPAAWWQEQLTKLGAVVHWQEVRDDCVAFYCSAWRDAKEVCPVGTINMDVATVEAQTLANIRDGWQQVQPHDRQEREVVLLCGGPSMADCEQEIRDLRSGGAAIVTVNGAYHWALDRGLQVGAQIVLDARAFNHRFVHPVTDYTRYLVASQCHPMTYAGLPRERTYQWHSSISDEADALVREMHEHCFIIPGGSTVVLRALPLLRMLGFYKIHLFGFDSCVRGAQHHAYSQMENDGEPTVAVVCGGKTYHCTPWMVAQASEFRDIAGLLGDEVQLAVHGDGLIAAMIAAGYEFAKEH